MNSLSNPSLALVAMLAAPLCVAGAGQAEPDATTQIRPGVERGTTLQGRAFLGRRQGVVGASVVVRGTDDPSRIFVTSSDGRGAYRLDGLPDGEYAVELRRDGLRPARTSGVTVRFPFRAVVELQMKAADDEATIEADATGSGSPAGAESVSLAGRVFDEDGRPLSDAVMRLVSDDARADPRVVRSTSGGTFDDVQLPAGGWSVELRGVGYLPIRTRLSFASDTTLRVTMIRQPSDYRPSPLELMPPERAIRPPEPAQSPLVRTAK